MAQLVERCIRSLGARVGFPVWDGICHGGQFKFVHAVCYEYRAPPWQLLNQTLENWAVSLLKKSLIYTKM